MRLLSSSGLVEKLLTNKKFRDGYAYEHVRNGVPFQIRAMREQRGWTQGKLGEVSEKPRNVISRLEDPNYGKFTLQTLLEIASAFDVALLVKFIPFTRLLREYEDTSSSSLDAASVLTEKRQLIRWARVKDELDTQPTTEEQHQLSLLLDDWTDSTEIVSGSAPQTMAVVYHFPVPSEDPEYIARLTTPADGAITGDRMVVGLP